MGSAAAAFLHTHTLLMSQLYHRISVVVAPICRLMFQARWARIIGGDAEGLYAWAAANYVSGALEVGWFAVLRIQVCMVPSSVGVACAMPQPG